MIDLEKKMVEKSIEAFILGLEIYNKPTIRYRIEGFSYLVCNAWELLLKSVLIKRGISIYFADKKNRTISLNDSIKKIYTNENTRIRLNLEKIIELRNIGTHFITEDYELKYVPLFQACVLNYVNELKRFQGIDITERIAPNFLTLNVSIEPLTNEEVRIKYPPEMAEKLIQLGNEVETLSKEYNSDKFSIEVKQNLYITKKREEADFIVSLSPESDNKVAIVKELKDPANTHKYSFTSVIQAVKTRIIKQKIETDMPKGFNNHVLTMIINFYSIKSNPKFAYNHQIGNQTNTTYSEEFVNFILSEMKKNPEHFYESLKQFGK